MFYRIIMILAVFISFNGHANPISKGYEASSMQLLWRSDIDEYESDFQAKIEPRYLDEEKKEFTYDLKIYGTKKGQKYLAYEEKDLGYRIYTLTTTAQGFSPLIIVSADSDNGEKVIRGYQYKNGNVTRGAFIRSLRSPEIALYPGESGLMLVYTKLNQQQTEKYYNASFVNREWLINTEEEFASTYDRRFGFLVR